MFEARSLIGAQAARVVLSPDEVLRLAEQIPNRHKRLCALIDYEACLHPKGGSYVLRPDSASPVWPRLPVWRAIVALAAACESGGH
jgi:hypothetical protein